MEITYYQKIRSQDRPVDDNRIVVFRIENDSFRLYFMRDEDRDQLIRLLGGRRDIPQQLRVPSEWRQDFERRFGDIELHLKELFYIPDWIDCEIDISPPIMIKNH